MARHLRKMYPWVKQPLLASAPMLNAATPELAVNVSAAGGLGFIAAGANAEVLQKSLDEVKNLVAKQENFAQNDSGTLPIGVGFQLFGWDVANAVKAYQKHVPAVTWLFAPSKPEQFQQWAQELRAASNGRTHIWIQVGSVKEAKQAVELAKPEVLVIQGADAGGHGLAQSASVISLVPETLDALAAEGITNVSVLAAGGIVDGRGMASALALGAAGVVMGTRFLAAAEAGIAKGWQREIVRNSDGGISTIRSTLCDRLKETKGWPTWYDGRALANKGHEDERAGLTDKEHVALYKQEMSQGDDAWGPQGRMVAYAGTGVGLIKGVKSAAAIVEEVLKDAQQALSRAAMAYEASSQQLKL